MMTRIAILYDGNFILHSSNYYCYIHDVKKRISINGLQYYFKDVVSKITNESFEFLKISLSHYFRGRLNAFDASTRGNQLYNDRVFDDILMSEGIQTHYLPLRNSLSKKEESGTTVGLSIEAIQIAEKKLADVIVLVISDTEYIPLVRKLREYDIYTIVAGWDFEYSNDDGIKVTTRTSQDLRTTADYSIYLTEEINEGLENNDPTVEKIFI